MAGKIIYNTSDFALRPSTAPSLVPCARAVPGLPERSLRAELLNCFAWALIYQHE